jgi:V/A-type H+-transporting ATPase subunit K
VNDLVAEEVWVALAVGLAVAIPGILAAMGVQMVGVAAAAVTAEDPKKWSKLFVLEVIPGTQGFYGFIAGMLLMIGSGLFGGTAGALAAGAGVAALVAMVPAILQGFTAYYQARVCVAGVSAFAKRSEAFTPSVIYAVMVETYAILGFITTFLLLIGLKLF